jgi:aminoglycoside phosphotransferase (APT) family kinase protein
MSGTEVPGVVIDPVRLGGWIAATLGGSAAPVQVTRLTGGQSNPTYLVTRGRDRYVLRRKPSGTLVQSAHAVDREYRVMAALAASDVPVARVHALCEDGSVIGTAFYLMEFVEGRVLWDPALPGVTAAERGRMYDELNRVIAALHAVDPDTVGLADFGRHGEYILRQVTRWSRQYEASRTEDIDAMDRLIAWLPEHVPADDETRIVHGDYRLDNVIFHPSEPHPRSTRPSVDPRSSTGATIAWRGGSAGVFLGGRDPRCSAFRQAEHVAAYCRRTGRPHRDAGLGVLHGVQHVSACGIVRGTRRGHFRTAASSEALEMGRRVRPLAELAWRQVESLHF